MDANFIRHGRNRVGYSFDSHPGGPRSLYMSLNKCIGRRAHYDYDPERR